MYDVRHRIERRVVRRRPERPERADRPERPDRPERSNRPDRPDRLGLIPLLGRLAQEGLPRLTAVLGTGPDGRPVALRPAALPGGGLLVLGDEGAGKSALLRTAVMSLALLNPQRELQFALLDPNGSLAPLANLPHLLTPRVRDPRAALDLLRFLMDARTEGPTCPQVVVVADDLGQWWRTVADEWMELAEGGPETGVHLVGALAPPPDEEGPEPEWGAALWLVGRLARYEDRAAAGVEDLPLERLPSGSFWALTAGDERRFEAAFLAPRRAALLAERLWNRPGLDLILRPAREGELDED
jgi:hypothetical protein